MSTPRILLLIKGLGRGGAEQILASAAPHLDRTRFDYEVAYLLPWKDALVKDLADADVPARCLDGSSGVAWVSRLRRLVSEGRFDLVHAHSPVAASAARVVLAVGGPPIVYTEHNEWERYHPLTYWSNMLTFAPQPSRLRGLGPCPGLDAVSHGARIVAGCLRSRRCTTASTHPRSKHGPARTTCARNSGSRRMHPWWGRSRTSSRTSGWIS